jgi:hypothetical protein
MKSNNYYKRNLGNKLKGENKDYLQENIQTNGGVT